MTKSKSTLWWLIFIILSIWQIPQLLVGLVMWIFLGKKELVADRHFNFCWKAKRMLGGISLGPISFVSTREGEEGIAHEVDGHTVQSKLLGWLYLPVIGLPSLIHAWFYERGESCYYDYWCEKWANKFAGLETGEDCRLRFKD